MAFSTYDDLLKTISKRIERGTSLDTEIDDFILLAEKEMLANPSESLKINEAETISTALTDTATRFLALPTGFKKSRNYSITLSRGIGKLTYRTPNQMNIRNDSGTPCFYTNPGNEIAFDILPQEAWTVTIDYFKDFLPLTVLNQTNIILDKYPNIYLFGSLRHAFIRAQDTEQANSHTADFLSAIESANMSELEQRNGNMAQQTVAWSP